jgi:hypothetical protein
MNLQPSWLNTWDRLETPNPTKSEPQQHSEVQSKLEINSEINTSAKGAAAAMPIETAGHAQNLLDVAATETPVTRLGGGLLSTPASAQALPLNYDKLVPLEARAA